MKLLSPKLSVAATLSSLTVTFSFLIGSDTVPPLTWLASFLGILAIKLCHVPSTRVDAERHESQVLLSRDSGFGLPLWGGSAMMLYDAMSIIGLGGNSVLQQGRVEPDTIYPCS